MKKSVDIIGFPIISISSGEEIGKVKSMIVNPEKGSVDFLIVEHEQWQVSVKAIPFQTIIGIGKYAITVDSIHSIIDLNEIPIANQLINKNVTINGTKVMTRKGNLVGHVNEFHINEKDGQVESIDIINEGDVDKSITSESVITYGEHLLILNEDFQSENTELGHPPSGKKIEFTTSQESIDSIDRKQAELLEGRQATKDIKNAEGQMVVTEGTVLTDREIKGLQKYGPSVMVELSMNVK